MAARADWSVAGDKHLLYDLNPVGRCCMLTKQTYLSSPEAHDTMRRRTLGLPIAFFFFFAPKLSVAAPPTDPCSLITEAEVSAALINRDLVLCPDGTAFRLQKSGIPTTNK
jgi:hypothetical protein